MATNLHKLTPFVKRLKYFFVVASLTTAFALCSVSTVIAGSGLLSSISGVTFIQGATQFWISDTTPTFSGLTTAGVPVDITIGGVKNGVVADSSGDWSYTHATELTGDNEITIATSESSITFTLTIGALPENIASSAGSALAPAGSVNPTLFILGGGLSLLIIGALGWKRSAG
ncbi:hypothetical protein HY382_00065 [Candidatus Curtissbacteria bacterium]|nr:hypothetical protein [Candidatus Curtissbacteria bacterium]